LGAHDIHRGYAMVKRALISVSDKAGIVEFAVALQKEGIEILSTGGTAKLLRDNGIVVKEVSEQTGHPEILSGRVKTLHPRIHAGILANRDSEEHMQALVKYAVDEIDLVVVNLYPFQKTIERENASLAEAIENIDIGGPAMVRSAAKNFEHVAVVVSPEDYPQIINEIQKHKAITQVTMRKLALKAFQHTAFYDTLIAMYLHSMFEAGTMPDTYLLGASKKQSLRYGENPHQEAAFYVDPLRSTSNIALAKQLQGKELSYNNYLDMDAAFELVHEFEYPAATVIKHTNPCGAAVGKSAEEALEKAYNADPMSAFGCIIALNRGCTKACAEFLKDKFIEVIVAPSFDDDAKAILSSKKSLRLMETGPLEKKKASRLTLKKISGGLLVQSKSFPQIRLDIEIIDKLPTRDDFNELLMAWKKDMAKPWQRFFCVTKRKPAKEELADLIFAWKVNKHVKSNAVLYAKGLVTVGIGAGQMSRVDSTIIASQKAGDRAKGAAMSSDAFFPFRDGIDEAAKVGITSIIQPGGSIRDKEAIEAADQHSMAMLFTGIRLFKH